jgi:hypothetical protein
VDGSPEARADLLRAAELAESHGHRPWLLPLLEQLGETEKALALRADLAPEGSQG